MRGRGPGGGDDLFLAGVGPAERDVVADRAREERRFLEDDADLRAQRLERDVAHVEPVDRDLPAVTS